MVRFINSPDMGSPVPDAGFRAKEQGRKSNASAKTEPKTMLGLSPADIKQAIDLVDDLIQAAQSRCTDEVRARQLRTLVLEYYRWRREEEH